MPDLYAFLNAHGVAYTRYDHTAVYTSAQARLLAPMPGASAKNLFLRDKKGLRYFLLTVDDRKPVDLKQLAQAQDIDRLSLASPERLKEALGIEPGAVSPLALINDPLRRVEAWIDRDVWQAESLHCHPLVNTATLVIPLDGLRAFLRATGHTVRVVEIP
jgi:Ala-tRNA(Pro) deacylase